MWTHKWSHTYVGVNISFHSQILDLGKVSRIMEFWEEFPCFGICAIFCCKLAIHKEKPFPVDNILELPIWELFPIIYPFPDKKTGPDLGNFSQLKVMEPSILLLTFPGLFYLHKIKSFSNLDFFQIGKYFQLMLSLLVKITCTDQ